MNPDIRDEICDMGGEDALMFDNPDFDEAVIGLTTDGQVVYDFNRMVADMVQRDGVTPEDATDFIDYTTIRSLPYAGENAPIIMYPITTEVRRE